MGKHKNKLKNRQRVICPVCFDNNPKDRIELIVKKVVVKWSNHPLLRKHEKLEIDYGLILEQESKNRLFYLICPKCKTSDKFTSEEDLIKDLEPMVEYIAQNGAFGNFNQQPKPVKETSLPKIVRISSDDRIYQH